jgi:cytochrome P450 family 135
MTDRDTHLPPGPSFGPRVQGQLIRHVQLPLLELCRRRYGNAFTLRPGPQMRVVLADPSAIRVVFRAPPEVVCAGQNNAPLLPIFGPDSILLSDGEEHLRKRRRLLAVFREKDVERTEGMVEEIALRHIARWPRDETFSLHARLRELAFDALASVAFNGAPEVNDRVSQAFDRLMRRSAPPLTDQLRAWARGRSPWSDFEPARDGLDAVLYDQIAQMRGAGGEDASILDHLMSVRGDHGESLSDTTLRDELATLIVAGHETTASALAWLFNFVFRDRDLYEALKREARGPEVTLLNATITETLRLGPVVLGVGRALAEPLQISDWLLPTGTLVAASAYLTHRRADLFPQPLRFRPTRFLDASPGAYEFLPFGGGARRCLGASFADREIRVIARAMLRSIDLRGLRRRAVRPQRRGPIYAPSGGVPVLISS